MSIYDEIASERRRAHEKHKHSVGGSIEDRGWHNPRWFVILMEEVGEVCQVYNDDEHGLIGTTADMKARMREELIQVAAVAASWAEKLGAPDEV